MQHCAKLNFNIRSLHSISDALHLTSCSLQRTLQHGHDGRVQGGSSFASDASTMFHGYLTVSPVEQHPPRLQLNSIAQRRPVAAGWQA
jgi:hypothetical protein